MSRQERRADALVRGRPPGQLRRDEGVPRGPRGPPYLFYAAMVLVCLYSPACAQNAASATSPSKPEPARAEEQSTDPLHRDTPQSSLHHFLDACQAKNYGQARRYLDLRQLLENQRAEDGPELARQLEQILDHDARFDIAAISQN